MRRHRRQPPHRAVITGASSGIGSAFARDLAGTADLLLTGRDAIALEALAFDLRSGGGGAHDIRVVTADLVIAAERAALISAADTFAPDLLVNDAGLGTWGGFLEEPVDRLESTILVDVLAHAMLAHALLPGMLDQARSGQGDRRRAGLVNLSSTVAFTPVPLGSIYGAAKAFVLSFTEALAAELVCDPVDVLAVCTGPVRTGFFRRPAIPGGPPPFASSPTRVARQALHDLGRRTVSFSDLPSAMLLRPVACTRVGLSDCVAGQVVRHGF